MPAAECEREAGMSNDFFSMRKIVKQYEVGGEIQTILKGIDLDSLTLEQVIKQALKKMVK